MSQTNHIQIIKDYYKAYADGNRQYVEDLIPDDFVFSAPPDPLLTRQKYFERCWPGSGKNQSFEFKRLIEQANEVIVTYETNAGGGRTGRNTEIFTFIGDKVARVEVYFGWWVE